MTDLALDPPLFGLTQADREARLNPVLRTLTHRNIAGCASYKNIVAALFPSWEQTTGVADVPFLPVGIFKRLELRSVPSDEVFKTITSSGTTGVPSRVYVDRETAKRQTKALASIMGEVLGPARRPMLIVDSDHILTDRTNRTARAAGVVGMMSHGRHHTFLLDGSMEPRPERLRDFLERFADQPVLIFGFTFMVWQYLYEALGAEGFNLSRASLVHSGGWKQMEAQRVDNKTFKSKLRDAFGIEHVVNFYGMAEQVGSVFVEGPDGLLHPSSFAEVIVRDPLTWEPLPPGEVGVLQVLSTVPTSYPGHSILTEDLGVVQSIDHHTNPMGGKAFRVIGRLPKAELRGCSDTFATELDA